MTCIEATATIGASPEQVWEFISDPERYPEWAQTRLFGFLKAGTSEMFSVSETPIGEGTVYHERGCCGPITFESEWRVINWEPPHYQTHRGEFAGVTTDIHFCVEPATDEAKYRQIIDVNPLSRVHPLGEKVERWLARRLVAPFLYRIVTNLKITVEANR